MEAVTRQYWGWSGLDPDFGAKLSLREWVA